MSDEIVVGIDLGTTNSEVAAYHRGEVRVLGPGPRPILPSCVGVAPGGGLLIGSAARNQHRLYPERTIRSVKRKMGTDEVLSLGEQRLTPPEVSSLILRELVSWASQELGQPVRRAVITVPAYFSDAQRQATREAGQLAGLEVARILNEPTAASLAYGFGQGSRTALVYDLGGGTFDVSVVQVDGDVTEVLASHGNTQLGGDDFDRLLVDLLVADFRATHGVDLSGDAAAMARLWWAAEEAKKQLSMEPFATVREEALAHSGGKPLHLEREIRRDEYEERIAPLLQGTLDSVAKALRDAGKTPDQVDEVVLVGGSTRTPLIWQLLSKRLGRAPRQDVDPDLCVALGAGVLASRLAGRQVDRVLVDVSPYSFGPSFLGVLNGSGYPYCYTPVIRRNTPLPVTRTEVYFTTHDHQTEVRLDIFQGEHEDALRNVPIGELRVEGLKPVEGPNEVLVRMELDLDGILQVCATEKRTGLARRVTIEGAGRARSEEEIRAARERLEQLFEPEVASWELARELADEVVEETTRELLPKSSSRTGKSRARAASQEATGGRTPGSQDPRVQALGARFETLQESMHPDDAREGRQLHDRATRAADSGDDAALAAALSELEDLLFYSEPA